ncbi:uncharacterized protein FOMMEDRAFT_30784 [Fomitiporia mediterranea MF3/22]|uniref:uncharacterized protein n=1 Tax=Fomitiporia mediterranea (strain MF3/22) TaxID=694068 RepID=UPI0004408483|nr:uncharacterized protein FOMMEDRAFT_30784 [Fomitiporia mediterranea MF3/22]EJD00122.1 hypothetical protein FOMMEDRAFT_30784 [Fomitiporia mediterranea MF3/22]
MLDEDIALFGDREADGKTDIVRRQSMDDASRLETKVARSIEAKQTHVMVTIHVISSGNMTKHINLLAWRNSDNSSNIQKESGSRMQAQADRRGDDLSAGLFYSYTANRPRHNLMVLADWAITIPAGGGSRLHLQCCWLFLGSAGKLITLPITDSHEANCSRKLYTPFIGSESGKRTNKACVLIELGHGNQAGKPDMSGRLIHSHALAKEVRTGITPEQFRKHIKCAQKYCLPVEYSANN